MNDFSEYLLVSDVDGTLLRAKNGLSKENKEAIRYFVENGGKFTIATGRSVESAYKYAKELDLSLPSIHINGGCIYNYKTGEYLYETCLPDIYYDITKEVIEKFHDVGIVAWVKGGAYLFDHNETTKVLSKEENMEYTRCKIDDIPFNPFKMLFISENGEKPQLEAFLRENFSNGVDYVSTSDTYFEMIPKGISKGKALKELANILGVDRKNIIAAGDYENDIEMIQYAGLGAAVGNAMDKLKEAADVILPDCEENAIAFLIEKLKQKSLQNFSICGR